MLGNYIYCNDTHHSTMSYFSILQICKINLSDLKILVKYHGRPIQKCRLKKISCSDFFQLKLYKV